MCRSGILEHLWAGAMSAGRSLEGLGCFLCAMCKASRAHKNRVVDGFPCAPHALPFSYLPKSSTGFRFPPFQLTTVKWPFSSTAAWLASGTFQHSVLWSSLCKTWLKNEAHACMIMIRVAVPWKRSAVIAGSGSIRWRKESADSEKWTKHVLFER